MPYALAQEESSLDSLEAIINYIASNKDSVLIGKDDDFLVSDDPEDINLFVANNQIGNSCFSPLGYNPEASKNYAAIVSNGATLLDTLGIRLFSIPCPTSAGLLSEHYRELMDTAEPSLNLEYIESLTNNLVYNVNIYPILREHDHEYLYFRTDHHWTALAAYYAYVAFCEKAGFDEVPLSSFEVFNEGEFTGTYYPNAARIDLLKKDELIAYRPRGNYVMTVKETSGSKARVYDNPIVDYSTGSPYNKYNSFILGDNYFVDIENLDLDDNAPSCAVIKDSFGDPFSVFLTQHYKHVYVLDYRHFKTPIAEFAKKTPINDVIICQSMGVSQTFAPQGILEVRLMGF